MKTFDRGAAREGQPTRARFQQACRRPRPILRFRDRLVAGHVIDNRAHFFECFRQLGIGDLRPQDQHFQVIQALELRKRRGNSAADILFRHHVHLQVQFRQLRGRARPHGRDVHRAQVAQIFVGLEKIIEERRYPVRAREDQPVVRANPDQHIDEILMLIRRHDLDRRNLDHFGAQIEQLPRKLARLIARSRHHYAGPEQGPLLKPIELLPQLDHLTDYGDGGSGRLGRGGARAFA